MEGKFNIRGVLGLVAFPVVLWFFVDYIGPFVLFEMYSGRSFPFLNALISGQKMYGISFYQNLYDHHAWILYVKFLLFYGVTLAGYLVINFQSTDYDKNTNRGIDRLIFFFPLLILFFFLILKWVAPGLYKNIVAYEGILENFQAYFYLISVCLCFGVVKFLSKSFKVHKALYTFSGLVLFFILMEEISWGQRLFHFDVPEYFLIHNEQEEVSIHNLKGISFFVNIAYSLLGLYGALSHVFVSKILKLRDRIVLKLYFPHSKFFLYFFSIYIGCVILSFVRLSPGNTTPFYFQEVLELLLSMGIMLFLLENFVYFRDRVYQTNAI